LSVSFTELRTTRRLIWLQPLPSCSAAQCSWGSCEAPTGAERPHHNVTRPPFDGQGPPSDPRRSARPASRDGSIPSTHCGIQSSKNYLFDGEARQGGGVYLWKDIEAAKRWHDDAWRSKVVELYGSEPVIRYFETPFVVDNAAQDTVEERLGER
jgi:hypothetical protein